MMKKFVLLFVLALMWNAELTLAAAYGLEKVVQASENEPVTAEMLYRAAKYGGGKITVIYKGKQKTVDVWLKKADRKELAVHIGKHVDGNSPRFLVQVDPKYFSHVDWGNGRMKKGKAEATEHGNREVTESFVIYLFGGHLDFVANPATLFEAEPTDHTTPIPADGKPVIRDKGTSGSEPQTDTPSTEELIQLLRKGKSSGPVIRTKK